jgi:hypothetical protein
MGPDSFVTRLGNQVIPGKLLLRATRTPWRFRNEIELRMAVIDGAKVTVATSLIMTPQDEDADFPPLMAMSQDMGQQLMDQLWECGLRPSEGAGQVAAVQAHLADMRALVFKKEPK